MLQRSAFRPRKRERFGIRPQKLRSEGFQKWVRGRPCLIEGKVGHACSVKIQFAHVRMGNDGGTALKPSDCHANPLCVRAHREQHDIGEPAFERKYGVKLNASADDYWSEWLRKQPKEVREAFEGKARNREGTA